MRVVLRRGHVKAESICAAMSLGSGLFGESDIRIARLSMGHRPGGMFELGPMKVGDDSYIRMGRCARLVGAWPVKLRDCQYL